jgi:hypothetical protein
MADVLKEDDENDVKGKEEELVIVEEDPAKAAAGETEDDSEDEDERVVKEADSSEDAEREAIRERRRQEKQERKERREKAITRDKIELDFLRKRNDELERRLTAQEQRSQQFDLNQIDAQIEKAKRDAELAERVIAKAIESGNGADVAQALRYRDQAISTANQLTAQKQQAAKQAAPMPKVDDLTMHYAREFIQENPWYDPQGRDEDSAIVLAIDQALAKDGFNPQTEDYWDELRSRAARRLPERFGQSKPAPKAEKERQPRGGPAVGSGKEHAPASTRKEIFISPERKQALIEAGVWDDPVLRMKYVKRYAEYDRANKQ